MEDRGWKMEDRAILHPLSSILKYSLLSKKVFETHGFSVAKSQRSTGNDV